jgi:Fe-S-cluster-containing dehydrogenase component/Ni/Fe-hydrogenase subunit HybB-like protein
VNYGFLIDNRKCIGCHACTTACKSENRVPLGVNRTWVKYVEKGRFPQVRRSFQVTRCNHCANPPCVRICPVSAMFQRSDGIVDFDPETCIGCKACMQACPYDAIYIDPDGGTAAKCHFCAHRTEVGLEPACVVVCPEQAIVAGDLDDPGSEISRLVAAQPVSVRKPEQGTVPKLFYIDGDHAALDPTVSSVAGAYATTQLATDQALRMGMANGTSRAGDPEGPIRMEQGRMAGQMVQTAYNAQHRIPWHWQVPAYLVTKAVGSGIVLFLAFILGLGLAPFQPEVAAAAGALALVFVGATTVLLVWDLERPERFYTILTRPQWRSWLTRGAFILIAFSGVVAVWTLLEFLGARGAAGSGGGAAAAASLRPVLLAAGALLAVATAVYTAFLFGQAEGRDLWQSTLLPGHLVVQAVLLGAGALLGLGVFLPLSPEMARAALWFFAAGLLVDLVLTLMGELGMRHASEVAARAAREITRGRFRRHFWWGSVVLGHLLPLALLAVGVLSGADLSTLVALGAAGAVAAAAGLFLFEYAFVLAPQEIPNS